MKKLIATLLICIGFIPKISAQDQEGIFSVSANLNYGTDIETLGAGLRAQYGFTSNIRGALEYKYYFSRDNRSAWEWNANAHYVFGSKDELVFYPLVGLKFTRQTYDFSGLPEYNIPAFKKSNNRLGLNLGFGSNIAIGEKWFLQPEVSYEFIKDYSQLVISAGVMYRF